MYSIQYLDAVKDDLKGFSKATKDKLKKAIEKN